MRPVNLLWNCDNNRAFLWSGVMFNRHRIHCLSSRLNGFSISAVSFGSDADVDGDDGAVLEKCPRFTANIGCR